MPSLRTWFTRFLLDRLRTARGVSHFAFALFGARTALIDRRGSLSYRELRDRVWRLHGWMQTQGLQRGDIVFTWLPETGEQYEARLATYENGSIFASFHQHLSSAAALAMIERLKPALFIHDPALSLGLLPTLRERMPQLKLLALGTDYEAALASVLPLRGRAPISEDDVFSLHMTSGTTGEPKALGYTHRKYLDSVRLIARAIDFRPPKNGADVNLIGLPLTGPGSGMVLPTLLAGAALVMPENFRARTLAELIARHRVSRAYLSPSAIIDLLDEPGLDALDLSSLTHVPYGSEMMPAAKIAEAVRRFGPIFQQGYGCFEALPPITWLLPEEHVDARGEPVGLDTLSSVGRVIPGVEVVIRDEQFAPLPDGSVGLITVRTPVRFDGYWLDPEKTRETLRDGWVVMGDVGYFDTGRHLHVLGRTADRVRQGEALLNPREIEELAHRHAAVKEVCLVQHGAQAALVVSLRQAWRRGHDRAALECELDGYLRALVPVEHRPARVCIVDEIPRSFLNKMLRREVRAMLEARDAMHPRASSPTALASH